MVDETENEDGSLSEDGTAPADEYEGDGNGWELLDDSSADGKNVVVSTST